MQNTFDHYCTTMRPLQTLRWGIASILALVGVSLYALAAKCLPERHPTRAYIESRVETTRSAVIPALLLGCPSWGRRLGRGLALATLALILGLTLVGAIHTGHHVKHRNDPNVRPIDMIR